MNRSPDRSHSCSLLLGRVVLAIVTWLLALSPSLLAAPNEVRINVTDGSGVPRLKTATIETSKVLGFDADGNLDFFTTGSSSISDTAYDATSWNGVTETAPSKNAVRDQVEVMLGYFADPSLYGSFNAGNWRADLGLATTDSPTFSGLTLNGELRVNPSGGSVPAQPFSGVHVVGATTAQAGFNADAFAEGFRVGGRRANGTAASPSAVLSGETIGSFYATGYGATGYSTARAGFYAAASQNWTDTANGTHLVLLSNLKDTTTSYAALSLRDNGAARVGSTGAKSIPAWGTTGAHLYVPGGTVTDSTSSGTLATAAMNSFGADTVAAASTTTITDAATVYVAGAPAAGTNATLTNPWSLWVDNGAVRLDGNVSLTATTAATSTTTGAFTVSGGIGVGGSGYFGARLFAYGTGGTSTMQLGWDGASHMFLTDSTNAATFRIENTTGGPSKRTVVTANSSGVFQLDVDAGGNATSTRAFNVNMGGTAALSLDKDRALTLNRATVGTSYTPFLTLKETNNAASSKMALDFVPGTGTWGAGVRLGSERLASGNTFDFVVSTMNTGTLAEGLRVNGTDKALVLQGNIHTGTADAADTRVLAVSSGGAATAGRGGYLNLIGNEYATAAYRGVVEVTAGNESSDTASGSIRFNAGGSERARIWRSGGLSVGLSPSSDPGADNVAVTGTVSAGSGLLTVAGVNAAATNNSGVFAYRTGGSGTGLFAEAGHLILQPRTSAGVYRHTSIFAAESGDGIGYETFRVESGNFGGGAKGVVRVYGNTASTNSTTGALTVAGGAGVAGNVSVGGSVVIGGGAAHSTNFPLRVNQGDTNAQVIADLVNLSAGSSASATFRLQTDVGAGQFSQYSAAHATWPGKTLVSASSSAGGTGLALYAPSGDPLEFWSNNALAGSFTSAANFSVINNATIAGSTASSSPSTGALVLSNGGLGVSGNGYFGGGVVAQGGNVTVSRTTNDAAVTIRADAGYAKYLNLQSGAARRWVLGSTNTAEAGSDAGSNFVLQAYSDADAFIDSPITVGRAATGTIDLARDVNIGALALSKGISSFSSLRALVAGSGTHTATANYSQLRGTGMLMTLADGGFTGVEGFGGYHALELSGSGSSGVGTGLFGSAATSGTKGGDTLHGGKFVATLGGAGTWNSVTGISATLGWSGGTVTDVYGARISVADMPTVTNGYGVKVEDVTGATNNYAIYTGAGAVRLGGDVTLVGAVNFADGVRQTFNPNGTAAGINVGSQAGDPSSPSNGDLWYDSTANELTARINGANVALGAGGGGSVSDTAYDATSWNGDTTTAPSKNAVRDKFEALAPRFHVQLLVSATNTAWTNQTAAKGFWANATAGFGSVEVDLTNYSQCRLVVWKASTAANTGATIELEYASTGTTAVGSFADIGTSALSLGIDTTNTLLDTGWVNLAAGAKGVVWIAITGAGGDGAIDPNFGFITAYFK